jgi:hypothetical protein
MWCLLTGGSNRQWTSVFSLMTRRKNIFRHYISQPDDLKKPFCTSPTLAGILKYSWLWAGTRRLGVRNTRSIMTNSQASALTATSATSPNGADNTSNEASSNGRPQKLHGRAFYESIGSPKFILAPMVDQSEFVRIVPPLLSTNNLTTSS